MLYPSVNLGSPTLVVRYAKTGFLDKSVYQSPKFEFFKYVSLASVLEIIFFVKMMWGRREYKWNYQFII